MSVGEIDAAIDVLLKEKLMLVDLKGAINGLTGKLDTIARHLSSCSNGFSNGGLLVDGVGVDVAVFGTGGLAGYGGSKVTPLSASFKSMVSEIDTVIKEYDNLLTQLYERRLKTMNETQAAELENRLLASRRRNAEAGRRVPTNNDKNRTNPRILER